MKKYENIHELKLDIDTKMKYTKLTNILCEKTNALRKLNPKTEIYAVFNIFRTHKGYHVYIAFSTNAKLTSRDIVALQLIYGSDPAREIHNLERIDKHIKNWNVLFTEKYKVKLKNDSLKLGKKISVEKYAGSFIY